MAYGYNEREDIKKMSAKEFIDYINLEYYKELIENYEYQITNIRIGHPRYEGIKGHEHYKGELLVGAEAKNAIKGLEKNIEKTKKKIKKYASLVTDLNLIDDRLDKIAQEQTLIELFRSNVGNVLKTFNEKTEKLEPTELGKKHNKKIYKLISRDKSKTYREETKVTFGVYVKLKRFAKKLKLKNGYTLKNTIAETRFSLDTILNSMLNDMKKEYREKPYQLGIKEEYLDRIKKIQNNEDEYMRYGSFYYGEAYNRVKSIEALKDLYKNSKINEKAKKIVEKYKEIIANSKELETLDCILKAFEDTSMKNMPSYQYVQEIYDKTSKIVREELQKSDKMYDESNIEILVQKNKELENLYRDYLWAVGELRRMNEKGVSSTEIFAQEDKIRELFYKMDYIFNQYPELYTNEYRMEFAKMKEVNNEVPKAQYEPITEAVTTIKDAKSREYTPSGAEALKKETHEYTPSGLSTKEEQTIEVSTSPTYEEPTTRVELTEDEKLKIPIEMPPELAGLTTYYLQEYVREKRMQTELGKLRFSEYLEKVRPDLVEFIRIEKQREKKTDTIYKKYLQYRMFTQNKGEVSLSFKEYAQYYYNMSYYDMPVDIDERIGISK